MRRLMIESVLITAALLPLSAAQAGFIEFTDRDEWFAAVGEFTTIDFTGFPDGTLITEQFASSGVHFTDSNDTSLVWDSFLNDGFGLEGNPSMRILFDTPQANIAVDFLWHVELNLFSQGILLHSSLFLGGGLGHFGGVISDELFDEVLITDPGFGGAFIDDLHFGVPAPGALALLGLSTFAPQRRRQLTNRSSCQAAHRAAGRGLLAAPPSAVLCSPGSVQFVCGGASSPAARS
jgi:hypothetical protein